MISTHICAFTTAYDALDRRRRVANPANKLVTYAYDAVSNRSVLIDPDGGRLTFSYDLNRQITRVINPQADRTTFSYDETKRCNLKSDDSVPRRMLPCPSTLGCFALVCWAASLIGCLRQGAPLTAEASCPDYSKASDTFVAAITIRDCPKVVQFNMDLNTTPRVLAEIGCHADPIFAPSGEAVASILTDRSPRRLVISRTRLAMNATDVGEVGRSAKPIQFSPDGKHVIVEEVTAAGGLGMSRSVQVFDVERRRSLGSWPGASFSLSGERFFFIAADANGASWVLHKESISAKESIAVSRGVSVFGTADNAVCITIDDSIATLSNVVTGESQVLGRVFNLSVSPDQAICYQGSDGNLFVQSLAPLQDAVQIVLPELRQGEVISAWRGIEGGFLLRSSGPGLRLGTLYRLSMPDLAVYSVVQLDEVAAKLREQ